jgi:hypothetical protein
MDSLTDGTGTAIVTLADTAFIMEEMMPRMESIEYMGALFNNILKLFTFIVKSIEVIVSVADGQFPAPDGGGTRKRKKKGRILNSKKRYRKVKSTHKRTTHKRRTHKLRKHGKH